MELKIKGHLNIKRIEYKVNERRGTASPIPMALAFEPSPRVMKWGWKIWEKRMITSNVIKSTRIQHQGSN